MVSFKAGEMDKNKWVGAYYVKRRRSMAEKEMDLRRLLCEIDSTYKKKGGSYVRQHIAFTIDGNMLSSRWSLGC